MKFIRSCLISPIIIKPHLLVYYFLIVIQNVFYELFIAVNGVRSVFGWKGKSDFNYAYALVKERTYINKTKLFQLFQFAKSAVNLEGDWAELGVYQGGSARMLAEILKTNQLVESNQPTDSNQTKGSNQDVSQNKKELLLFDTFTGMPYNGKDFEVYRKGNLGRTSVEDVEDYLKQYPNLIIKPGVFPETFKGEEERKFALVHIDCDLYQSVLDGISSFYPRMVKGGFILFDDYGYLSCKGAKKAVDEFFAGKLEKPIWLSTGQCLVIKS